MIKNEYMEQIEDLHKQEEALYITMQTWRKSVGREGWVDIRGMWNRTVLGYDLAFGSYGPSKEEMSASEIQMADGFSDILDHLRSEMKVVLNKYTESIN